jgi:uracil-DNA glycosylase
VQPETALQEIASQVSTCRNCQLSASRKRAVPGEGPDSAEIMLIGEGPGFYENEQGRPFVGAAGKFLDELLQKAGVSRQTVFITNVVKCRPPGNRDPLPEELLACGEYLERQIAAINPLIIVTLGRYSMSRFLPNVRISEVHGKPAWVRGRLIVPMFHPAAALHQPSLKTSVERDFARLPEWIAQARQSASAQPAYPPAEGAPAPLRREVQATQEMLLFPDSIAEEPPLVEEEPETEPKGPPTQLSLF